MKFCKYCGAQIDASASVCPNCNRLLGSAVAATHTSSRTCEAPIQTTAKMLLSSKPNAFSVVAGLVIVIAIFLVIFAISNSKCSYGGCKNKAVADYDYCYSHKCSISDCNTQCYTYSNFCYSHYLRYDDEASSNSNYVASYELKFSGINVYSSGNYTYAEGALTNNSDSTVTFVEIKGAFKNASGNVIDTDWTYAVGSEGLAPGESCKWKLSVSKDYSIDDCEVSILDYDY